MASTIIITTSILGMLYTGALEPEATVSLPPAASGPATAGEASATEPTTPPPDATPPESEGTNEPDSEAPSKDYLFNACKRAQERAQKETRRPGAKRSREKRADYWCDRVELWARQEAVIEAETRTFRSLMSAARDSRCKTAICWGPSNRWGLEPIVELPVGKTFSLTPSGLGRYINNSGIGVRFNAGVRLWWRWDWVSAAIYFATPDLSNKETIVIPGSDFQYPVSQIRRPLPGLAIGLLGDTLWVGFDYDQLRNGGAETTRDPRWPANEVVSHAFSVTIAVAPMAGFRNGIGTLVESNRRKEQAKADEKAAEKAQADAAQARVEAEQARAVAERARAEAKRAQDQPEPASDEPASEGTEGDREGEPTERTVDATAEPAGQPR